MCSVQLCFGKHWPAGLKAENGDPYLIQASKVPGLKGMPWPMSPRITSPCVSRSKASSTLEKSRWGIRTICITTPNSWKGVHPSVEQGILTQHGRADVNAHPVVPLVWEVIATQPSAAAGRQSNRLNSVRSRDIPSPRLSELGPRNSPNIQHITGLILRHTKKLHRPLSHLGLDINHPWAKKPETQESGKGVLG